VADKTHKMIRIKWVRSGIGFTYRQKTIVHSLGLRRLNQVVSRVDTPQNRGIVAAVPHLLEIVSESPVQAWTAVPEHSVHPPAAGPAPVEVPLRDPEGGELPAESAAAEPAAVVSNSSDPGTKVPPKQKAVKADASDSENAPAAKKGSETSEVTKS
jgi:large subunit ribosomal protein L30